MQNKKMEFSKKWLIGCIIISIFYTSLSYILAFLGMDTVENLSAEILQVLWGASSISFVFYCGQNSVRAYTSSKWGIPEEQKTEVEIEEVQTVYDNRRGD